MEPIPVTKSKSGIDPFEVVERLCGIEVLDRFAEHFGGRRLYVPYALTAAHPLAEVLGLACARTIASELGGVDFELPIGRARRLRVKSAMERGIVRSADLAVLVGITQRAATKIKAELRALGFHYPESDGGPT